MLCGDRAPTDHKKFCPDAPCCPYHQNHSSHSGKEAKRTNLQQDTRAAGARGEAALT